MIVEYLGQACSCETTSTEPEAAMRLQFPFYNEIQSIFAARLQRMLWSQVKEPSTSSSKRKYHQLSSEEEVDEPNQDINEELLSVHGKETEVTSTNPRKRVRKGKSIITYVISKLKPLREWRDAYWEMKEKEREMRERDWRRRMEELEEERATAGRMWMEREEERRFREEDRAQKRDALIDALLNKLNRDHNDDHRQGF